MLKYLFFLLFIIPLGFMKEKCFWYLMNMMLILSFLFISLNWAFIYWINLGNHLGLDVVSYGMILLSMWICSLMLMASEKIFYYKNYSNFFSMIILMLMISLYLTFSSVNMFIFYMFFEGSLIPTLFLILGWGYQPERVQAGVYLLFYTLLASLPLLISIFSMYYSNFTLFFDLINMNSVNNMLFYIGLVLSFLVKIPMYLLHLWLPSAHVEAPISGSMGLAGVLLKLGGYGLMRIFPYLMKLGTKYNFGVVSVSIVGSVLVSLSCLRLLDFKQLIAYSSVAHMGVVTAGIMTFMTWGLISSYTLMIAHGLCSSGLFCLANINYERVSSRSLLINKGFMNFMPSMTLWWFMFSASNMSCPPTLNLLGEVGLFNSIIGWSWISMLGLSLISFFSAAYSLYLYSYSQHGKLSLLLYSYSGGYIREYLLLFLHWFPLNFLIMKSDIFMLWS